MNNTLWLQRRSLLLATAAAAALALAGCATQSPSLAEAPPIVFVHGNGDTAALWQTTVWRFESNGWPRERLHAIDVPYPLSRDEDAKPQAGRTSAAEHMAYLRPKWTRCSKPRAPARSYWWATRAGATPSATTLITAAATKP